MKTPVLDHIHKLEGARMVEFAGWRMPVSYTSILKEASAVRNAAGLFDVTHMGRLKIKGEDALKSLQMLVTNDLSRLADFQGQYNLVCNEQGGVVDDIIVYRKDEQTFYLVVNASNTAKDKDWIREHLIGDASLNDLTEENALFALQGPKSTDILSSMDISGAGEIRRFWFDCKKWKDIDILLAKTGYTGEDGYEIACRVENAEKVWLGILDAGEQFGIERCGLGSRDVLRIEAGLPLYGNELDEFISPVEAGLMRFVKMDKGDFIGRKAIESALSKPPARKLTGLLMQGRSVPRTGDTVAHKNKEIGTVTSGTWSPTLKKGIGMAYILPKFAVEGEEIEVLSKGRAERGYTAALPVYSRGK